jgi:ectoine hydroxylase-related dioxygenase (phytanoyl-CoA dioxygenase family)
VQAQLLHWCDKGYMIIPGLFEYEADNINAEIERLKQENAVDFNFTGRKIMDAWQYSEPINKVFRNNTVLKILEFVFQKKPAPFQTINFIYGSEQRPHSDSIHMTTEPLGYLAAIWIALEDIHVGSGELMYYPGSHKLNYVMSEDYNTGNNALKLGEHNYDNYEEKINEVIEQHHFKPQYFHAKKGDVLIWHANLLHGGSSIIDPSLTRKSMVAHYYADGVLCYHEISQRPAVIKN